MSRAADRGLDDAAASGRALALALADRVASGAPGLETDAALAAVAAAHSRDMRDGDYFGHGEPVGDRLAAAGYRARAWGENVAENPSLAGAQAALMASDGHRANLVSPLFTHIGVAAVRTSEGWLVTQIFARPYAPLPADAGADIAARIAALRGTRGLAPLRPRSELTAIAAAHAPDAGVAGVMDRASAEAWPLATRGVAVSAHVLLELDELTLPDAATDPAMTDVGAAACALADGRVGAIVIVTA